MINVYKLFFNFFYKKINYLLEYLKNVFFITLFKKYFN